MDVVLGVDIGGSGMKAAPVDVTTGELLAERMRIPTPQGAEPDAVLDVLGQLMRHFDYQGTVGVTFPGIVQGGRTLSAANVSEQWVGMDADTFMTQGLGDDFDVHLLNDADAAGLAEARFGAAQGVQGTVLVVTLGTGIGSALLMDGQLVPNTELGHLFLQSRSGKARHAESWASARVREDKGLSYEEWGGRVSRYLNHLELLFSPTLFVVGGGVSKKADKWLPYVQLERSRVVPAALKNEAGIVGAAMYAAQQRPSLGEG
ncbi:polyphosphate--glucose phosphotransferase [Deinococcus sp. Marseille-Q6407]|uniref:polyphosphate--glucose phosphotransferase n=1 Tax=Deinococcus sp. Marseille-Q6407 TaxID=2969223 RepID=UPI0021BE294B|nr:ROK family protein [Deinococcus sp. Marseille-Q6407]